MSAIKNNVSSAALIVAGIALIVAMAGSAIAGSGAQWVSGSAARPRAGKQREGGAPQLWVKSADTARQAQRAEVAETAKLADVANLAKRTSNVMAATVPIAPSCAFDANTGGITAVQVGNACDVTFPRSIEDCAVGATPHHPMEDVGGEATIRRLNATSVKVTRNDPLGNGPVPGLFAIYAICS